MRTHRTEAVVVLNICRFVTLLLAALALTMESAHVLELPQKLAYDPQSAVSPWRYLTHPRLSMMNASFGASADAFSINLLASSSR